MEVRSTKNYTRVNNVLHPTDLLDCFISCDTYPHWHPQKMDHLPIISILEIELEKTIQVEKYNFRATDWVEFRKTLAVNLNTLQIVKEIAMEETFYDHITKLDAVIKATMKEQIPLTRACPYAKRWWTKDLTRMKKCKEWLARKSYRRRADGKDPTHEDFGQAWNTYSAVIRRTKEQHWTDCLESLDEEGLWVANHMVSGAATDRGRSRILTLSVKDPTMKRIIKEARTNREKGQLLYQDFFPKRKALPAVATAGITIQEKWTYIHTTDEQIHRAIKRMKLESHEVRHNTKHSVHSC